MLKSYNAKFRNDEVAELLWDGRDEHCFNIIEHEWNFVLDMILKTVKNTRNVIQAGGNCGLYPLHLSQYFERVFTFEPDPVNFYCLASNCKNNKIVKFNAAISDEPDFVMVGNPQPDNNGMTRILIENETGIWVYTMTVDSLKIKDVDLILLDVEGHEYNALQGCRETLIKNDPVVIIEVTRDELEIDILMTSLQYKNIGKIDGITKSVVYKK